MKLAVSYDAQGNILTLFSPEALRTERGFFTYVPGPGEEHRVFDLPKELEGTPFVELPHLLRVNWWGQLPRLECMRPPVGPTAEPPADLNPRRPSEAFGEVAD